MCKLKYAGDYIVLNDKIELADKALQKKIDALEKRKAMKEKETKKKCRCSVCRFKEKHPDCIPLLLCRTFCKELASKPAVIPLKNHEKKTDG